MTIGGTAPVPSKNFNELPPSETALHRRIQSTFAQRNEREVYFCVHSYNFGKHKAGMY